MKQLTGNPNNIDEFILGKITFKNNLFLNKSDLIYVVNKEKIPSGFKAVLSCSDIDKKIAISNVSNIKEISYLKENDIVTIEPNGTINVIFENNSNHNALFTTERCNSNCIMCPQPPVSHEEDMLDINLKTIQLIKNNASCIGITGGEPTLLGDKFFVLLDEINKKIPRASINILSNGIKFKDYEFAKQFSNHIKQEVIVDIPLYSDIDNIHNSIVRTNTFYSTIEGIYNLAKLNIKIGLRIVVHRMNYERLPEFSEYIYSNFPFLYNIAFMQMEPIGNARNNLVDLWIDPFDYIKELEKAVLNLYYRDLNVSIYNFQLCLLPETIRKFAVRSISEWKNIYLDECNDCNLIGNCPGFFESAKNIHSQHIAAIKGLQAKDA